MSTKVSSTEKLKRRETVLSFIPCRNLETHKVVTEDGYILTLFRLNKDKTMNENEKEKAEESSRIPVLFICGLFNDGTEWLLLEDEKKRLPNMLAKEGFDCWMGTLRGTPHSKEHASLKTTSKKFWDFSLDEHSKFDLPALIDCVLTITQNKDLFYIGYSMGGYIILPMLCLKPEYTPKIRAIIGLSPGIYGYNFKRNPLLTLGIPFVSRILRWNFLLKKPIGTKSHTRMVKNIVPSFTKINRERLAGNVLKLVGRLTGSTIAGIDSDRDALNRLAEHMPSSTSFKHVVHISQIFNARQHQMFNYGRNGNIKRYGTPKPPLYDLTQVTTPVATFSSDHDRIIPSHGVLKASEQLPNLISHTNISAPKKYTHCDFLIGTDVHILIYPQIVEILKKFPAEAQTPASSMHMSEI